MPDGRHVVRTVTAPEAREILAEYDVEHPVQVVIDMPVTPDGVSEQRRHGDALANELRTIQTTDGNHGRIEVRRHVVSHKVDWLAGDSRFPGVKSIAMVKNTVERNNPRKLIASLS